MRWTPTSLLRSARRAGRSGPLQRFGLNESGATAIEFSLLALPFFLFIFVIIETALILWSNQILDRAVSDASRKLYTGEFQKEHGSAASSVLAAAFKADVCEGVVLFDCAGTLKVDVQTFTNFPTSDLGVPVTDGEIDPAFGVFESPAPGDIVLVRVAGAQQVIVPSVHIYLANLKGNRRLITASAAFRSEQF